MSLRRRLLLGVLALVTGVVATVSVLTWLALRSFLVERLDVQLSLTPPALVEPLCRGLSSLPLPPLTYSVAVLGPAGSAAAPCRDDLGTPALRLTDADAAALVAVPGVAREVRSGGQRFRAIAQPIGTGGNLGVLALPLSEADATLHRLLALELVLGVVALAATSVVGAFGVRLGLRPLEQVTGTALAVAGDVSAGNGGLDRRVHRARAGTEVGQLARAFNQMLTEVQTEVAARRDSEQRMRQFLADASHELRTPLTTLRGYAELLRMRARRDGTAWVDAESADALWRVESEGTRMARLVDDLMSLARADQRVEVEFGPVRLDDLAAHAVADLRAAHPRRTVRLRTGPGCVVLGDRDQLQQVLANLLTNAAVHTRPSGGIRVEVRRHGDRVTTEVDDDGPGLAPRQAAHVFDRFWRADPARSRARGGSGLGLPIVDALVTAHRGTVHLDTSPAGGTTVRVDLPAGPAPHPGANAASAGARDQDCWAKGSSDGATPAEIS